jgi:hypothetical protein
MKKVLSIALMMVFVAGMAFAQEAKKPEKKESKAKTEAKADTSKKAAHHHKGEGKKMEKKK